MSYKVLIIYDVHCDTPQGRIGWAFWRRAEALRKYAPNDFQVTTSAFRDVNWSMCGAFDLVFNIEYSQVNRAQVKNHAPNIDVPLVASYNSDSRRRTEFWPKVRSQADFTIFNNLEAFEHFGRPHRSCCISNGVDTNLWYPKVPIANREHRVLWSGSSNPQKGKGYHDILLPLKAIAEADGFVCDFCPVNHIAPGKVRTTEEMLDWYNSGSYIVCASLSEGTPGMSLEGMACGCVLVTTAVGNAQEFGIDQKNLVFTDRDPESFLAALRYARTNREILSFEGAETMHSGWSYGEPARRAEYFFGLFRRIIRGGAKSVAPFAYCEKTPEEI